MISKLNWTDFIMIMTALVCLYYWFLFRNRKKALAAFPGTNGYQAQFSRPTANDFPELIEKSVDNNYDLSIALENEIAEDMLFELAEDEDSLLLKEAEILVSKIQAIVAHIASNPPNPMEVFTKIKAIVSQYKLFENTEYYEAINNFITITVDRDCGIEFSREELVQLWG